MAVKQQARRGLEMMVWGKIEVLRLGLASKSPLLQAGRGRHSSAVSQMVCRETWRLELTSLELAERLGW